MSKPEKIASGAMTVLTLIAVYAFFAFKYPYHLHFQEQYQLFEATWAYFASVGCVPGGFADWLGRGLTQFFYYAPAGAAIMAVLLMGVQLLCWAVCKGRTLPVYALTFLPVILLLAFYCDENSLTGGAVALLLSLGAAALILRMGRDKVRFLTEMILVPLLYFLCGPLALTFAVVTAVREIASGGKKGLIPLCGMLALLVLCPLAATRLVPYPLDRLCYGIHYFRYPHIIPGLLWIAAILPLIPVLVSVARPLTGPSRQLVPGLAVFAVLAAAGAFFTLRAASSSKEEWMRYDFMVRMQMWNRLMMAADVHNPDNPKTVSCLNLALSKTGRMADSQFEYFQNGPQGLIPDFHGDYTNPVSTSEIFWHLGMVNSAQRFAFEAQEAIPDFQKSARLYRRLAETNLVNGDWDVARKYLKALQNTAFYRRWADETLTLMDQGTIFDARPELARVRQFRLKEHDFLFSVTEMDSMLGLLKVENPENRMALDYLMGWCLLRKDLDRFVEVISLVDAPVMPKSYQEALLLRWVHTHTDFNGLPSYLSPVLAQRMGAFIADLQARKPEEQMRAKFGDTYWFYYYYRYKSSHESSSDEKNDAPGCDGSPYAGGL